MGSEFFDQLHTFSLRYFKNLNVQETVTPWGPDEYDGGSPAGAVLHYTADGDLDRVVRWFMCRKYGAQAAANVIVADRRYARAQSMLEGLPLVAALPVTIIQCAMPQDPTWHARWASSLTYGIELLNSGELRSNEEGQPCTHWRRDHDPDEPEWTMPWQHETKEPVLGWGRKWEPYTKDQVQAVVTLLGHLREMYPKIRPGWVLGHEGIQNNKRDPGPLLPMSWIRTSMMGGDTHLDDAPCVVATNARDDVVLSLMNALGDKRDSYGIAWHFFQRKVVEALTEHKLGFGVVGKTALKLLGYHVPHYLDIHMHDDDRLVFWLFQKAMNLKPDSIPGPRTRKALLERLHDRGVLVISKRMRVHVRSPRGTVHVQMGPRTLCGLTPTEDWSTTTTRINRCTTCEKMVIT